MMYNENTLTKNVEKEKEIYVRDSNNKIKERVNSSKDRNSKNSSTIAIIVE